MSRQLHLAGLLVAVLLAVCWGQHVPDEILEISRHPELAPSPRAFRSQPLHPHRPAAALRSALSSQNCRNRTRSCRDCHTVNQCAYVGGSYEYMTSELCSERTPFCDEKTGECVAELPSYNQCSFPVRQDQVQIYWDWFKCYSGDEYQGYYPSPYRCDGYFVCSAGVAYVYNCPSGYEYVHAKADCLPANSASSCSTFNSRCRANRNKYILDEVNPSLYAFCDQYGNPHVSKCRPDYQIDPNQPEQPCQPYCAAAGRIPNGSDPRGYYECYAALGNDTTALSGPVEQWCPPGLLFSDEEQKCILEGGSSSL